MTRVIARAEWGARYRDGFGSRSIAGIKEVWLHHSVTAQLPESASFDEDAAQIRSIESIGESRFKGGISYTYLITPSGRIFQGHSLGRIGAHTAGHNTVGVGVCLVGNYEVNEPSAAQLASIVWLLQTVLGRNLNGGHRDTKQTACPGARAYNKIPGIKSAYNGGAVEVDNPAEIPAPSVPSTPVLKRGSKGDAVKELQNTLNAKYPAYSKLKVDGIFGVATETAVKEFQRRSFITVDGIVGPVTSQKLGLTQVAPPAPAPAPPAPAGPKPDCTAFQRAVRTPADNVWGANTDRNADVVREASGWGGFDYPYGVKTAQAVVGAKPDGVWGPASTAAHDQTVRNMQAALHSMGFDAGPIDGVWGDQSEGAYQGARNACHV